MGPVDLLLIDYLCMSAKFPTPRHLYSHQEGTFLDEVLDDADSTAKVQALQQSHPMPVGYIEGLQPPQPGFWRDGVQRHDSITLQIRLLC